MNILPLQNNWQHIVDAESARRQQTLGSLEQLKRNATTDIRSFAAALESHGLNEENLKPENLIRFLNEMNNDDRQVFISAVMADLTETRKTTEGKGYQFGLKIQDYISKILRELDTRQRQDAAIKPRTGARNGLTISPPA
jgi:hypothetical protein